MNVTVEEGWAFFKLIMNKSLKLMHNDSVFATHANGTGSPRKYIVVIQFQTVSVNSSVLV